MSGLHDAQYRALHRRSLDLWSVGCSCGWLRDVPLRGSKDDARIEWRQHRADEETASLGRLMKRTPRPR